MIHEIGIELQAKLIAEGCPFRVVDREAYKPTSHRNVIVIDHTSDTFGGARSQSDNPKRYYTRNIGTRLTIYAQSTRTGALEFEHRRQAERVIDLTLVALRKICATRRIGLTIGAGRFITIADLEKSDRQGGAVYELAITFERGVADTTWAGAADPEGNVTNVTNSTSVARAGVPEDDGNPNTPETACGA